MSDADTTHAPDAANAGHDTGHEPEGEPLGPIDTRVWAIAIGGAAVGVLLAIVMFLAAQT